MESVKIAIIGAGIGGLACALECEKLGVITDVYERDHSVGWVWPSISYWPSVIYRNIGDPIDHLKRDYDIDMLPLNECKTIIIKSPGQEVKVRGKLGYFYIKREG